jgi:hypothetical protein
MAIKPITNKQVVDSTNINRADQLSTKNSKVRGGNTSRTVIPGNNYSKNYAVTLKDVDSTIIGYVKNIIRPQVREANENVDVTVMYGNEERWKNARKRGVMRDRNGSLILPLIMLKRTEVAKNTLSGQSFQHDVKGEHISVVRNSSWSKDNRYDRFSVQTGMKPAYENIVTGMPNFADVTYEFVLWTAYIEQMNPLVELFVDHSNTYWGQSQDYKLLSLIDGSLSDVVEMDQAGERFVKSSFTLTTKAQLLPEYQNSIVTNKISTMRRELTPSKIVFGFEGDATNKQVGTGEDGVDSDLIRKLQGKQ